MKNLLSTLFLGAGLVLGGCDEQIKKEKELEKNYLKEYNEQNFYVYKNFMEFVKEKGERKEDISSLLLVKKRFLCM